MRVRRLGGLLPVVVASRANSSTLLPVARGKPGGSYRITAVVVSIRPVLKHGPRSLTCMRVAQSCPGLWGVMKVSGVMSVGGYYSSPGRNTRPLMWTCSIHVGTRKMVIYAWARRSQGKLWWRSVAILTCKSIVRPGYRGERLIEPSSSWFLPKFPSG
jgi:hypothetical protein